MKTDLDRLMSERDYAALLVTGGVIFNPYFYYLTNGAKLLDGIVVKKRGEPPVLLVYPMERDEAVRSGLHVVELGKYDYQEILQAVKGDRLLFDVQLLTRIFDDFQVQGQVAAFGRREQGAAHRLITTFNELNPHVQLVGEYSHTIFDAATVTKDADEADKIRTVGQKAVRIMGNTADFLTSHRVKDNFLVKQDDTRLVVADVKRYFRQLIAREGIAESLGDTIFAIGSDAGVPHNTGTDDSPLALGQSIVFDMTPSMPFGCYFFDFTRTWCLGYAPPEVEQAHRDVWEVSQKVQAALKPNELCRVYQKMTCDEFEARGYPTIQSDRQTKNGYVHNVGHGLGLTVHESPSFGDSEQNNARLEPGVVFTIEPGLYYPERGFGVRIEDTLWLNPKTLAFEMLADYPKDLVLPMQGQ